jgi:hypothetical protein
LQTKGGASLTILGGTYISFKNDFHPEIAEKI